jgi:hypothetical protein
MGGACELGPKGAGQAGEEDRFVVTASGFRVREGFLVNLIILSPLCNSIVSRGYLFLKGMEGGEVRGQDQNEIGISIDRRKLFHMKGSYIRRPDFYGIVQNECGGKGVRGAQRRSLATLESYGALSWIPWRGSTRRFWPTAVGMKSCVLGGRKLQGCDLKRGKEILLFPLLHAASLHCLQ